MAPFEMEQVKRHALADKNSKHYGHFEPTPQRYPAYSAGVVPFLWMMRDKLDELGDRLELDVDASREPELGYETQWVHEAQNQTALLKGFAAHLRREDSLCLVYAKHVPFVEGTRTAAGPLSSDWRADAQTGARKGGWPAAQGCP
jgi:hypothetical protein